MAMRLTKDSIHLGFLLLSAISPKFLRGYSHLMAETCVLEHFLGCTAKGVLYYRTRPCESCRIWPAFGIPKASRLDNCSAGCIYQEGGQNNQSTKATEYQTLHQAEFVVHC